MRWNLVLVPVGMAIGLGIAGCASTQSEAKTAEQPKAAAAAPKAAPAAAAAPKQGPKPAVRGEDERWSYFPGEETGPDQPKPAGDNWNRASMYYPTGDRGSSVILIERMSPAEVRSGQEYDYLMRVTNLTNMDLKQVMVHDNCATNYTYVSSTPAAMGKPAEPLTWDLGDMGPKASKEIRVKGKAAAGGPVTNCATVTYNTILCTSTLVLDPALKVAIAGPSEASACDNVCYVYTVTNTGTGVARDVKVSYALPAGWVSDAQGSSFDAGTLAVGQSKEFKVCAKPNKTGAVSNTVSAAAAGGLTAAGNTVQTAIKAPVLAITAECPGGTTLIGREMTFKFTVKNTGDMASAGTMVTAPVPSNATFARADNGGAAAAGKVSWNLGSLAAGAAKTVTMTLRNTGAGNVQVSAAATGGCAATVQANCSSSVMGVPDIGTRLEDDKGVVMVGDTHTFTYTVKNQGQVDLTNVTVAAEMDPGLDFVSTDWPAGAQAAGTKATWKVGTIRAGEQKTFRIICKGSKTGELVIQCTTTSDQTPRGVRNDEQVNYIER